MARILIVLLFVLGNTLLGNINPLHFKENKGQWPNSVLFGADFLNTKFYVNKNSFNYCLYNFAELAGMHKHDTKKSENLKEQEIIHAHNYEVKFINGNLNNVSKQSQQETYYNYFLGNNKSKWASNVKGYGKLQFTDVYADINMELYSAGVNLKYDFIVKPYANVNKIQLNYCNTNGIELVNKNLIIKTSVGNVTEKAPFAYQIINGKRQIIKCEYILIDTSTVGFEFPEGYDKKHELIIDPTVIVCSYSDALIHCGASACSYDANGNIYAFGYAQIGYPTSIGAFQTSYSGYWDFVLSVYNSSGTSKLFATYLGGDSLDLPMAVVVKNNQITLMGQTLSSDFPYTNSAFDTTYAGSSDLVISKLNMTGTMLLASTYIGGTKEEPFDFFSTGGVDYRIMGEMVCDNSGNVYVVSSTKSSDFPVSAGALSGSLNGVSDAVVFKMNNNLSQLSWSTYLGGSSHEDGKSIRLDGYGGAYVIGTTNSTDFPVTTGAYQTTKLGASIYGDNYVSHINTSGTGLFASTYLGVFGADFASLMDLDQNNDVYFCGHVSTPTQFTATAGTFSNPNGFNVLYKLDNSLSNLIFKTKFGNFYPGTIPSINQYLTYSAFKVDSCQNIYLAGYGDNSFPTTPNAFQPTFGGGKNDLYFAVFSQNCASLKFASFYGGKNPADPNFGTYGEHVDGGINHFDNNGVLYQSICINGGLPTTATSYAPTKSADSAIWNNAFIKVDFQTFVNASSSYGANIIGCPPFTATFVSTTNLGTTYWNFGDGNTSTKDTVSHLYTNLGLYNVLLVVTDTNTCNKTDSIKSILNVVNPTSFDLGEDIRKCLKESVVLKTYASAVSYTWSTGQTTPTISVIEPGNYVLTINNGGCNSSDNINVRISEKNFSAVFPNVITTNSDGINDCIDFSKYEIDEIEFVLYDRWGKERHRITDAKEKWCPANLTEGTYFYVVEIKSSCTGKFNYDKGYLTVFK